MFKPNSKPNFVPLISSLALIVLCSLLMYGFKCSLDKNKEKSDAEQQATNETSQFIASLPTTKGNHTWIALDVDALLSHQVEAILSVLNDFEAKHPELEVTYWHIEKRSSGTIDGLWVDHKSK